jgi:hypothetical protein
MFQKLFRREMKVGRRCASALRQDVSELELNNRGREPALEGAALLLRVGHRSPNDEKVASALFDIDHENAAILRSAILTRVQRGWPQMRIAGALVLGKIAGQFRCRKRSLKRATAQGRSDAKQHRKQKFPRHFRGLTWQRANVKRF